ncbi:glycosyltransferase, partial [Phocaeicola vulgatus]
MKIAYCTDSICYAGGIQRVTIAKANKLALKNEVWIIVTDNKDKPVFPLSTKVHLVNCDINYFEDDWKSRFYILKGIIYKRKQHKKRLKEILNQIQPDIVISTGTSEKNFLPYLSVSSHPVFIREIHSNKNYRSLHAQSVFDKLLAILGDFIDYRIHLKKYDRTVVLTKEDKVVHWGKNTEVDVCVIPNPIISFGSKKASLINKKVIAVGRLAFPKNFSSLISAWKYVIERHADWTLEIWGEGELRTELEEQIRNNQLTNNIFLKGYT